MADKSFIGIEKREVSVDERKGKRGEEDFTGKKESDPAGEGRPRMTSALARSQAIAPRPDAPPFDGVAFLRALR